jgi:hypothetical protein
LVKRLIAVATLTAAAAAGSLLIAGPASADTAAAGVCLHVSVNGQAQDICLPPSS